MTRMQHSDVIEVPLLSMLARHNAGVYMPSDNFVDDLGDRKAGLSGPNDEDTSRARVELLFTNAQQRPLHVHQTLQGASRVGCCDGLLCDLEDQATRL